jgi:hypothetical protein
MCGMFVRDPFFTLCTTCDAPAVWCLPSKKPVACEDAEHRLLHMTANACALIGAPNTETWGKSRVAPAGAQWESPLTCEHLERPILFYRILVSFPDDPLAKLVASCAHGVTMLHVAIFNFVHGLPSDAASSFPARDGKSPRHEIKCRHATAIPPASVPTQPHTVPAFSGYIHAFHLFSPNLYYHHCFL